MVEHSKRRKFHDKDKYYRLAKEQGLRSRAAFKLSQINRKFHLLENAKIVIDLCAAPGGWTQVASRAMSRESQVVVAVDILPIRPISPNVISLIGDITTEKCKSSIRAEMQGAAADVVLCDGAPNVGASYDRDAYEQNEIALHALKCATEHLKRDGSFVTKIYRSADYSSYLWVVKQFFRNVQAVKPTASRSQSAEIFLVCQGYLDPTGIDPRMLDPKHVFEQVEGAATGGGDPSALASAGGGRMNIFHKKYGEKRRSRQGYDMSVLDATMRSIGSVSDFIESGPGSGTAATSSALTVKDPVRMLSVCTGLGFSCRLCKDKGKEDTTDCNCSFYRDHALTTPEIKACLADLKVLSKPDFKELLKWRENLRESSKVRNEGGDSADTTVDDETALEAEPESEAYDSEAEEEQIQEEIQQLRQRKLREQKKLKKKARKILAKKRQRAALGMDLNAVEVPDNEKIFSLAAITSEGDLEAAREVGDDDVEYDDVKDDDVFLSEESDDEHARVVQGESGSVDAQGEEDDMDGDTGYSYRLDRELDSAYDKYLRITKNGLSKSGTKMAKRTKKRTRENAKAEADEDKEAMLSLPEGIDSDTKRYAQMLQNDDSSDDNGNDTKSDEEDDGFHSAPLSLEEHKALRAGKERNSPARVPPNIETVSTSKNPLIRMLPSEPSSVRTARWFSNTVFEKVGSEAQTALLPGLPVARVKTEDIDFESDDEDSGDGDEYGPSTCTRLKANGTKKPSDVVQGRNNEAGAITADDVLAMIPKTDKQKRHEKRKKLMERDERKRTKRARLAGESDGGYEVAHVRHSDSVTMDSEDNVTDINQEQANLEARDLIKAGLGTVAPTDDVGGFKVVSTAETRRSSGPIDKRAYNSDNEDYDSDDYAQTLALGTMMLRHSKAKAMVDASYNRYAWNDPEGLPDWFVDDENKHHRPQLPIPPELLAKMKEKFLNLSTRPIAKVAEARARKNKRARTKLTAAKKKAEAVANSSEMSEAMKLKAISKAMRGQDAKRPGKTYVVSRKGGTMGAKGVKLVDKRMKSDKRAMDRATKKRMGGRKGGLTGSKRRRHHK